MSKKMMLLALSVVAAALFALPAVASATSAHISAAETFTATSGETGTLELTTGEKIQCHGGMSAHGNFENTTTGTITLTWHNCTEPDSGVTCTTPGQPAGTIKTEVLPFHLVTLAAHSPGVLITPNAATGRFAHFVCALFFTKEVKGNGVLGTITSPTCGTQSSTASLSFTEGANTGLQEHTTHTGVNYHLTQGGTKAAINQNAQIHFANPKTITCT